VTKKEIVKVISDKYDEPQVKVKDIVQETFDLIVEALVREGRIELRNFGVFEVKRRKPRRARNPRTNEPVEVKAKNVVTFQPGKIMEERVRKAEQVLETKQKLPKGANKPVPARPTNRAPTPSLPVEQESQAVPVGAAVGGGGANTDSSPPKPTRPLKPR
jgi:integration host factor subunit beta